MKKYDPHLADKLCSMPGQLAVCVARRCETCDGSGDDAVAVALRARGKEVQTTRCPTCEGEGVTEEFISLDELRELLSGEDAEDDGGQAVGYEPYMLPANTAFAWGRITDRVEAIADALARDVLEPREAAAKLRQAIRDTVAAANHFAGHREEGEER